MRDARGLTPVLLCLVGAVMVLVAAGRVSLGLVGLLGGAGLAATRRTGRTLVGWVPLATGVGVAVCALRAFGGVLAEDLPDQPGDVVAHLTVWSFLTAVAGVLLFAAGAQAVPATDEW